MAITGRFVADFSDFERAVASAEVKLVGLETGSTKVANSLSRMVDQFSGRKVIQDATLMTEAVERLGGASKLTANELAVVSAKASEAAEKMRLSGMNVPENMAKLAAETRSTSGAVGMLSSAFGGLGAQLAGMFTVGSVIAFGKAVLDTSDEIETMAQRTGLLTDEVQRLMYISGQTGTSTQTFVTAIQTMQERLGDNNSGTIGALRELGINVEEFKRLRSYDQFVQAAEGLRQMEDANRRASLEQDLFGRSARELLPAIKAGMKELGDEAPVMEEKYVKSLAEIKNSMNGLWQNVVIKGGEALGILKSFGDWANPEKSNRFTAISDAIAKGWNLVDKAFGDTGATINQTLGQIPAAAGFVQNLSTTTAGLGKSTADLVAIQKQLDEENKASIEANKKLAEEEKKRIKEFEEWTEVYATVSAAAEPWQDVIARTDEQLVSFIQTQIKAGQSVEQLAKAFSLSVAEVRAFKTAMEEAEDAEERAKKQSDELAKLTTELFETRASRSRTSTDQQIADINRWATFYKQKLDESIGLTQEMSDTIDAIAKERGANALVDWDLVKSYSRESLQEIANTARANYEAMVADSANYSTQTILEFEATARAAQDAADGWSRSFDAAGQEIAQTAGRTAGQVAAAAQQAALSWSQAMDLVREGKGTMSGSVQSGGMTNYGPWGSPAHAAAVQRAYDAGRYFGPVVTRAPNSANPGYGGPSVGPDYEALGIQPPAGSWTWGNVGYMAKGGPVYRDHPYIVGERGPELYVPKSDGSILPNGAGAIVMHNNFNVNGTGADVARVVTTELTRMMRVGRKWPAV